MRIVLLFCGLLIFACGDVAMEITGNEQELYQNHKLLKSYFYRPERIKPYSEYSGMEVDSMYASLKDYFCGANFTGNCPARYTYYLPPEKTEDKIHEIENTKKYLSFGFNRKGILNDEDENLVDTIIVSAVYPISPAASTGLRKKDRLLSANGIPLTGLTIEEATPYLKDDDAFEDRTDFVVLRDGEIKTLPAMRKGEVQKPTVYLDSIEGIPIIKVEEFKLNTNNQNGTYAEFKKILQEIKGTKTAIIDLRKNPGGNIWHCTAMAAELVPFNNELVYDVEHYRDSKKGNVIGTLHSYARDFLRQEGDGVNIKWIILMNRASASCSERFAAAVKYNRPETVVIGQTSYGKGVGQIYTKTYMGGLAYITCLQTFYPNGKTFHNVGIIPDIPTDPEDENASLDAAIEVAKGNTNFAAKRSSMPARSKVYQIESFVNNTEPTANKRIEMPLFHQGE